MRWRSALFFVVLFTPVLARARAQDAQGSQAATDRIHGSVINSVTREPIGRALVFSTDNRFAAMTDSEGHFEFTFPAANSSGQIGTDASGERVGVAEFVSIAAKFVCSLSESDSAPKRREAGADAPEKRGRLPSSGKPSDGYT